MKIPQIVFGLIMSFVLSNVSYAQEKPEFNGVYVGVDGEYIPLTEANTDTASVTEYNESRGGLTIKSVGPTVQFKTISSQQVSASVTVPQNFESIFVRTRNPPENIFYSYVVRYFDYMRTPDGAVLDDKKRPATAVFRDSGKVSHYWYEVSSGQSMLLMLIDTYVLVDCGWGTSAFNVKIIDNTAVEFYFKNKPSAYRSPLVKQCGKDHTLETRNMAFSFGNQHYIVNLEP